MAERNSLSNPNESALDQISKEDFPAWLLRLRNRVEGQAADRQDFFLSCVEALFAIGGSVEERVLEHSHGKTDFQKLMMLVTTPRALELLEAEEPLATAFIEGIPVKREILQAEGGLVNQRQFAKLAGISTAQVQRMTAAGHLICFQSNTSEGFYPKWQIHKDTLLVGLPQTLTALSDCDPLMAALFFLEKNYALDGQRPLELLRNGNVKEVIAAAESLGEHGAP